MRKTLVFTILALLVCSSASFAGVPDPTQSSCVVTGALTGSAGTQFRFNATGTADVLVATVTLLDAFGVPVAGCSTSATVTGAGLCACPGGETTTGITDASGVVSLSFTVLGGYGGDLQVAVTSHCVGDILICTNGPHFYTSPDLDGSCDSGNSTGIVDLGLWAGTLPPAYGLFGDYNCDGSVGVVDLGFWAGGLGNGCP